MICEPLWEIAQQQERHETLLSVIEYSTSAAQTSDDDWPDMLTARAVEKPE